MAHSAGRPGDRILQWKLTHWPPKGMRQCGELPIYIGDHGSVTAFSLSLGEVMAAVSDHIFGAGRGKTPRWMAVPKVVFDVERMNLTKAAAKESRRFTELSDLETRCGNFSDEARRKLQGWFQSNPQGELVAHKPFVDMRAYVFTRSEARPKRLRFYESGLVLAPAEGREIVVQDHRETIRSKRSDALSEPLAVSSRGWDVFPAGGQAGRTVVTGAG